MSAGVYRALIPEGRPKDFIDYIEAIAADQGYIEPVDENYYQAFVELNQPQIEKLAITLLVDQENGHPNLWTPRPGYFRKC